MSEIARTGKWNPGGGRWLEIVPAIGVVSLSPLQLKTGFSFTRIYCTQGTIAYHEEPTRSDNGLTYDYQIKGFSPDDTKTKRASLDQLLVIERMVCRFCDNSGLTRLAGTAIQPLLFTYKFGTDADVPGSRGYALELAGSTTTPALYE